MIKNGFSSLRIVVEAILSVLRLDYLSCVLTIVSTILVGRRCWEGWALAGANCVVMCIIGIRTAQLGFIPANVFCMVMSAINLRAWRRSRIS
jgi:nicotinamide riboside transporter PnuC